MEINESLKDVRLDASVVLGRTTISIGDAEKLVSGSIVVLNNTPTAPVELVVNGKVIAKGEVVVVDDYMSIKIQELMDK